MCAASDWRRSDQCGYDVGICGFYECIDDFPERDCAPDIESTGIQSVQRLRSAEKERQCQSEMGLFQNSRRYTEAKII